MRLPYRILTLNWLYRIVWYGGNSRRQMDSSAVPPGGPCSCRDHGTAPIFPMTRNFISPCVSNEHGPALPRHGSIFDGPSAEALVSLIIRKTIFVSLQRPGAGPALTHHTAIRRTVCGPLRHKSRCKCILYVFVRRVLFASFY